jgi:putative copper resistance protein D
MSEKSTVNWTQVLVLLLLGSAIGLIVGMFVGGAANPGQFGDTGLFVRWGSPSFRVLLDLSQAVTIGSLVFTAFALQPKSKAFTAVLNLAAVSAGVWALSGTAYLMATYLSITGSVFSLDAAFADQFYIFITSIELGQYLALNTLAGFVLAIVILFVRSFFGSAVVAAIGIAALIPIALSGHSAGSSSHALAVNSLGLHLLGICIWVGGLVALTIAFNKDSRVEIVNRYSTLALFSFGLVAISGVASAQLRIGTIENWFTTGYGQVALLKVISLITLGVFGFIYRTKLIAGITNKARGFWKLVTVEFLVFGFAVGLGTALARTANPVTDYPTGQLTPAEILTGSKLPNEPGAWSWITVWKPDLLWSLICLALAGFYVVGVLRMRKRGDKWSLARTASWLTGVALLFYITNGYFNVYEQYLFSAHMIAHMLLTMGVPLFLVPGAPVTLISRAVAKRQDASRGVREWVLWAVHTKYARFIAHPIVASILFASSLVVFYFTPLFAWATSQHIGHQWMIVHFVITGYLFVQALVGVDPGPVNLGYPQRLMLLIATLAFHAFFGLALMNGQTLLLPEWFGAMGRTWGELPLDDQQTGGAIAWGVGEIPTAVLTLMVAIQWARSDQREAKRLDRASDRSGNQDVADYNEWLSRINKGK